MTLQCKKYIYVKFILVISILFMLTGCHSNYVTLSCNIKSEGVWNSTKTEFIFVGQAYAYQNAKGIAAFPDGGQSKVLYDNVNLYSRDTTTNKLTILANLTDLPDSKHFTVNLFLTDSLVYYNLYSIEINSGKIVAIDSTLFLSIKEKSFGNEIISSYNLKKKIADIPVAEWGLNIQEIYPKSDDEYIEDFICNKGGIYTRNAIIEQIMYKKSKQDIQKILEKMKKYGSSLDGYEKSLYEHSSEESYRRINKLLIIKKGDKK